MEGSLLAAVGRDCVLSKMRSVLYPRLRRGLSDDRSLLDCDRLSGLAFNLLSGLV